MADTTATKGEEVAWYNLVGQFRAKAQQFEQIYNKLMSDQSYALSNPALASDYRALLQIGRVTRAKIIATRNKIDSVIGWLKGLVGMNELGFIPLIPIAIVAASLAAITKWVTDAYAMSARIDEAKRLEAKGVPPERAAKIAGRRVASQGGGLVGSLLGIHPGWLIAGAIAVVALPPLITRIRNR